MEVLTDQEVQSQLGRRPGWTGQGTTIEREFEFADFLTAVAFVDRVAEEAQRRDHHPDLLIHGYNKVKVTLTTHSEGGVTAKDFDLAGAIDGLEDR
ncbi:MAG TPA: 4a-hydroxytetrahydrobiopterin dehydratase [Baekduia sp.]|nr:4a-hydroxytetrahydrobiopterin dehydratase [Baekduia sp.]